MICLLLYVRFFIGFIFLSASHVSSPSSSASPLKASPLKPKHYAQYRTPLIGSLLAAYNGELSKQLELFFECFQAQRNQAQGDDELMALCTGERLVDDVRSYFCTAHPESGDTPTHLARNADTFQILLRYVPEQMDQKNAGGNTPLHNLAHRNNKKVQRHEETFLLEHVEALKSVVSWYQQMQQEHVLQRLLMQTNNNGLTPLGVAQDIRANSPMVKILQGITPAQQYASFNVSPPSYGNKENNNLAERRLAPMVSPSGATGHVVLGIQKKNSTPPVSPEKLVVAGDEKYDGLLQPVSLFGVIGDNSEETQRESVRAILASLKKQ